MIRYSMDDAFVPLGTAMAYIAVHVFRGDFCISQSRTKRSADFSIIQPYLQRAEIIPVRSRTERLFGWSP